MGRNALNDDQILELEQRKYTVQRFGEEYEKKAQALHDEYSKRVRYLQAKARCSDCGVFYSLSELHEEADVLYGNYKNAVKMLETNVRYLKDRAMLGTNVILEALLISFIETDFQHLLDKEEQKCQEAH